MKKLSLKEDEIYAYISETIRREGYSPTVRDIQQALAIKSTSTVQSYLAKLEEKGLITRATGKSRSVRISEDGAEQKKTVRIPVIGTVAAGAPILAQENIESYIDFPIFRRSFASSTLFALKIKGESMIEAGILDGDLVIVQHTPTANNGDIVVAMVDGDDGPCATVKTYYKEDGHFRLQPENSTMQPIIVDSVIILGTVVSLFRNY